MQINKGFVIGCLVGVVASLVTHSLLDLNLNNDLIFVYGGIEGIASLASGVTNSTQILMLLEILIPGLFGYLLSIILNRVDEGLKQAIVAILMIVLYIGLNIVAFITALAMTSCC